MGESVQKPYLDDVCTKLVEGGLSSPHLRTVVELLYEDIVQRLDDAVIDSSRSFANGVMVPGMRWVIHDSDIELLKHLLGALAMSAATGMLTGEGSSKDSAKFGIGLLTLFVTIFYAARKKRVQLDATQYGVLAVLKREPCAVPTLSAKLSLHFGVVWDDHKTEEELERLKGVRSADGTVTDLVSLATDGMWSASDV
jgi:hypothetical protein